MITCECYKKIKDKNGKIEKYVLVDCNNVRKIITAKALKDAIKNNKIYVTNLKLTTDNRLIDVSNTKRVVRVNKADRSAKTSEDTINQVSIMLTNIDEFLIDLSGKYYGDLEDLAKEFGLGGYEIIDCHSEGYTVYYKIIKKHGYNDILKKRIDEYFNSLDIIVGNSVALNHSDDLVDSVNNLINLCNNNNSINIQVKEDLQALLDSINHFDLDVLKIGNKISETILQNHAKFDSKYFDCFSNDYSGGHIAIQDNEKAIGKWIIYFSLNNCFYREHIPFTDRQLVGYKLAVRRRAGKTDKEYYELVIYRVKALDYKIADSERYDDIAYGSMFVKDCNLNRLVETLAEKLNKIAEKDINKHFE